MLWDDRRAAICWNDALLVGRGCPCLHNLVIRTITTMVYYNAPTTSMIANELLHSTGLHQGWVGTLACFMACTTKPYLIRYQWRTRSTSAAAECSDTAQTSACSKHTNKSPPCWNDVMMISFSNNSSFFRVGLGAKACRWSCFLFVCLAIADGELYRIIHHLAGLDSIASQTPSVPMRPDL